MKVLKNFVSKLIALALLLSLLPMTVLAQSAHAPVRQSGNLLKNPGFEGSFVDSSETLHVAQNWSAWWIPHSPNDPAWMNKTPNFERTALPERVHGGAAAQSLVSFFATHTAGVYQQVSVTAGSDLRLTAFGKGWTSTEDDPLNVSIGGSDLRMRVGIDPFGGTDPLSSNIQWSQQVNAADSFVQFTAYARAASSTVTVFLYSAPFDARRHNDVYWDDTELVSLSGDAASTAQAAYPTPTPAPITVTPTPRTVAIGANLLSNPGFEAGFFTPCSWKADPVPWNVIPCEPWYEKIMTRWNTVQTPISWYAWWRTPITDTARSDYWEYPSSCNRPRAPEGCVPWHNPEYGGTDWIRNGPARLRSGENSMRYFTFWSVHEAGAFQTVEGLTPGTTLRFGVYMHAWRATEGPNKEEPSPFESNGRGSMHMKVGIDPTGGRNPWSSDIVWSGEQDYFDQFGYYQVTAVARANRVTVFTYSRPDVDNKHNDIYVDDAELVAVDLPAGAPAPVPVQAAAPVVPPPSNPEAASSDAALPAPATAVPDGSIVHTVQEGDTLFGLSLTYNVGMDQIIALNNITLNSILSIGQQLVIKAADASPTEPPPSDTTTSEPKEVAEADSATGEMCVRTFTDLNGDGILNSGENLVAGIDLVLLNASDQLVETYHTDGLSEPHCFVAPQGSYTLQVQTPAGRTPTSHTQWKVALSSNAKVDIDFGSVKDESNDGNLTLRATPGDDRADRALSGLLGIVLVALAGAAVFWLMRTRRSA